MTEDQLDALIGRQTAYGGLTVRVVDWVPEGPSLVLTAVGTEAAIQTDQFGEARRRAPRTWTEPVYDADSGTLHPLIVALTDG
ncbi:hypothetical protein H0Z60_20430 [Ectothiorhodospiraceae bacterium WFHF3C12]|nr:hypothetical protein [Ectothiorhodospiraceae bacterium WFHF3C12]